MTNNTYSKVWGVSLNNIATKLTDLPYMGVRLAEFTTNSKDSGIGMELYSKFFT